LSSSSACADRMVADGGHLDWAPDETTAAFYVTRDVDVLFVVDNSGSMAEEQIALTSAFGSFVEVREQPGVVSSYRIGITTTDNGNPWCGDTSPESGALR